MSTNQNDNPVALARQVKKAEPKDRIKLRARCLQVMPPKLRQFYDDVEASLADQVRSGLTTYWKLGEKAHAIFEAAISEPEEYTDKPIDVVSACLQHDYSVLYKAMHFFRSYNEQELEALLNLRMKGTGCPIFWSHVVVLLTVENKAKRSQLLHQTAEHNWTHEELSAVVNHMLNKGGADKQPGGRKHKVPKTVSAMLHNLDSNISPVAKKFDSVWNSEEHGILRLVQNTDPSVITPTMLGEFDRMIATLEEIKEGAAHQIKQLNEARKRVTAVLSRRAKEEAKEETKEAKGEADSNGDGQKTDRRKPGRPRKQAVEA